MLKLEKSDLENTLIQNGEIDVLTIGVSNAQDMHTIPSPSTTQ